MNVLSLFDGMSCCQIALKKIGIRVDCYYASEIKKSAIKVTKYNFPNTIHIGDVRNVSFKNGILYTGTGSYEVGHIDLLAGGSPCQDLSSMNKKQVGLAGEKSSLFWEYARILKEVNPTYFLLENVGSMPISDAKCITNELGVDGVRINSSLVSAQSRDRIYWTNIQGGGTDIFGRRYIELPIDRNISFQSILESGYTNREKSLALLARHYIACPKGQTKNKYLFNRSKKGFVNVKYNSHEMTIDNVEMLTRREMERLQTIPEGYTDCISFLEASNVLGDGWTVDVIAHILKHMEVDNPS